MAGVLGNMVSDAINAYSGSSSGTNLQTFLQKFTSSKGRYVDTLDPRSTFDVKIQFQPTITVSDILDKNLKAGLARVGGSLMNSLKSMGTNILDNLTGGLFSSLSEGGDGSVMKKHDSFNEVGKHTFIEYLAPANLLQGGEQWENSKQSAAPLELQLGLYIQKITLPNISMAETGSSKTILGEFPINGGYVKFDGSLQMDILNTKAALHERIFLPWLRECTLPFWSYDDQPYTTATITIDYSKHNDTKYVFVGCRPLQINTLPADQTADAGAICRSVTFLYDYMIVKSDLNVNDSWSDKLIGSAGSLVSGAAKMLNF